MFNAGVKGKRAKDKTGILTVGEHFNQQQYLIPTVTRFAVTDGSYVDTNDTAADTAGGQTIVLYGSGFAPGATVLVGSTTIGAVTFLDSGRLAFASPALGSGSYTVFVTNANGGTGILVPGLVYSGVPTFTTSAGSLGSVYETTAISTSVVATGDAPITYSLSSGSLPAGATLSSGGTISGTAPVDGSSTTYSFTVQATDADNQDSVRSFSLTINTDVVSLSSPANNTSYTITQNTAISNVTVAASSAAGYGILYTSSGLPSGLSMNTSTGIISGTPTVVASNTSIITATANTTSRTATLYLNWTVNLPGDLFWKYASLLMSANSAPNGNTFNTDASTINNEIVVVADTKPSEFHPFKEGYYSNYFDGTGDYITAPASVNYAPPTGTSWTIEFWFYCTASGATNQVLYRIGSAAYAPIAIVLNSGSMYIDLSTTGSAWAWSSGAKAVTLNQWNHVALVRNGGTTTSYINGVTSYSASSVTLWNPGTNLGIGAAIDGTTPYTGYISNVRVNNGTALYTAAFTPPTSPLTYVANTTLLTCQSNKLIDNSNNNFTITKNGDVTINPFSPFNGTATTVIVPDANNYSLYFDGTGDYLSLASNTAFNMGTTNFTVEGWYYFTALPGAGTNDNLYNFGSYNPYLYLWGDGTIVLRSAQTSGDIINVSHGFSVGQWYHLALVKTGTSFVLYRNGVVLGSGTSSAIVSENKALEIGGQSTFGFTGYLSNFRIVKDTSVYTAAFTPPTSPLPVIANTSLLTCQANTVIDNSNNAFAITVNGDARPARNGPFANTTTVTLVGNEGSAYFDGTGDYLTVPSSAALTIGTSSATVEFWIYPTAIDGYRRVITSANGGFTSGTFCLRYNNSSTFALVTSVTTITFSTIPPVNTWSHVAWVGVNGSSQTLYLNGVSVGTGGSYNYTEAIQYIGGYYNVGPAEFMVGYMSNVRVTKGTALYTTPFVPTWAPLTLVANTVLLTAQTNLSSNTKSFIDESNFNNIITPTGNANLGSFSPFGNSWSVYFDGTGDYLSGSSSRLNFGANDFTVEFWMWPVNISTNSQIIFQAGSGNLAILLMTGGIIEPGQYQTSLISDSTAVITAGAWHHVVVTRTGTAFRTIINGVLRGYGTRSFSPNNSSYTIGGAATGTAYTGYISNFRVFATSIPTLYTTSSTTLATTIFTTPTNPFVSEANTVLLTCNSNQLVDYSAANNVITRNGDTAVSKFSPFSSVTVTPASYSGYFDGTGDYLTRSNINFGTNPYTIEGWFYITAASVPSNINFWGTDNGSGSQPKMLLVADGTQFQLLCNNGSSADIAVNHGGLAVGRWHHIAVVKEGTSANQHKIYLNGTALNSTSTAWGSLSSITATFNIGYVGEAFGSVFQGYISNFRIVNGTAVYTSNFTPSTTPLTAIANTVLLTCQSTTFVDTSNNASTITVNGDAKPVIQNPFTDTVGVTTSYSANTFGNSIYFDGTTDYLSMSAVGNPLDWPASANYTIEAWVYLNAFTGSESSNILARRNPTGVTTDWQFYINTSGALVLYNFNGSTTITASTNMAIKQWNHCAAVISGGTATLYLNGVKVSTATAISAASTASVSTYIVGASNSVYLNGYISNLRVVKGQALYTGPFIPSNQPLPSTSNTVLLLASTVGPSTADATRNHNIETFGTARRVANNSPYYDTYSAYFDGNGDYLTLPSGNASLQPASSDFTIEAWVYPTAFVANGNPVAAIDVNGSYYAAIRFGYESSGAISLLMSTNGTTWSIQLGSGLGTLTLNTWQHMAVSKSGTSVRVFLNGVQQGSTQTLSSATLMTGTNNWIGYLNAPSAQYVNGYISNWRLTKTALYTTTFTPPTTPLTAIANTSLLTCQSNRFIDNSTNAFTITKTGDVKITAFEPFANSNNSRFNSVYFGTKTDYLGVRPQPSLITFPGDFTFECWVYPTDTTLSTAWGIWDSRQSGATAASTAFGLNALASPVTGSWRLTYYNGTSYYGTGTVLWNQWTHVAWVRSGTTMTFYVNGVAGGTATISGTQTGTATTNPIYIGTKDNGLANYGTVGYIADLRITNGYARTITVPTAPYDIK